uniref:Uncharacterized protein n=1 Tax=Arundo donax TaxID=35708 RepID=A0A0A9HGQ4_ARUDO
MGSLLSSFLRHSFGLEGSSQKGDLLLKLADIALLTYLGPLLVFLACTDSNWRDCSSYTWDTSFQSNSDLLSECLIKARVIPPLDEDRTRAD